MRERTLLDDPELLELEDELLLPESDDPLEPVDNCPNSRQCPMHRALDIEVVDQVDLCSDPARKT